MDAPAVGGAEGDVDLDLVAVIGARRLAHARVGALQAADVGARVLPDEALTLVDAERAVGNRDEVAAVPAQQRAAARAVDAHPSALRRLEDRQPGRRGRGGDAGWR